MDSPTVLVVNYEVDSDVDYHVEALASHFPNRRTCDYPAGKRPALDAADAVVLSGSTAGVYEADDEPWIADAEALVRDLVDRRIPTLGVCFGHQLANSALGGDVEHVGTTHRLVTVDLADDPLFDGVAPVVPAVHGDVVTEPGTDMTRIAAADHAPNFGTRHAEAPLWTVQFHPEFTNDVRSTVEATFGWTETPRSYADVTAVRVLANFTSLVRDRTAV